MVLLDAYMPESCKDCELCTGDDYGEFCVVNGEYDDIKRPDKCPIVDVVLGEGYMKTGRWHHIQNNKYQCSSCQLKTVIDKKKLWCYCPNCGAYMYAVTLEEVRSGIKLYSEEWWKSPFAKGE